MFATVILAAALSGLPAPITGDFDFDGRPDLAAFVQTPGGGQEIIIRRGAAGHPSVVVERYDPPGVNDPFLDTAKSGRFETWCGKGGGSDDEPCARTFVDLRGGELMFGNKEASASVVIWTGEAFDAVLISD
jgi:hypothetical protein